MDITENTRLTMVVALMASQVLHETLDELRYTTFYKHSLKQAGNRFEQELTKTCDHHITALYEEDTLNARKVHNGIEKIAKTIANMKPSELAVFGELLEIGTINYIDNGIEKTIKIRED